MRIKKLLLLVVSLPFLTGITLSAHADVSAQAADWHNTTQVHISLALPGTPQFRFVVETNSASVTEMGAPGAPQTFHQAYYQGDVMEGATSWQTPFIATERSTYSVGWMAASVAGVSSHFGLGLGMGINNNQPISAVAECEVSVWGINCNLNSRVTSRLEDEDVSGGANPHSYNGYENWLDSYASGSFAHIQGSMTDNTADFGLSISITNTAPAAITTQIAVPNMTVAVFNSGVVDLNMEPLPGTAPFTQKYADASGQAASSMLREYAGRSWSGEVTYEHVTDASLEGYLNPSRVIQWYGLHATALNANGVGLIRAPLGGYTTNYYQGSVIVGYLMTYAVVEATPPAPTVNDNSVWAYCYQVAAKLEGVLASVPIYGEPGSTGGGSGGGGGDNGGDNGGGNGGGGGGDSPPEFTISGVGAGYFNYGYPPGFALYWDRYAGQTYRILFIDPETGVATSYEYTAHFDGDSGFFMFEGSDVFPENASVDIQVQLLSGPGGDAVAESNLLHYEGDMVTPVDDPPPNDPPPNDPPPNDPPPNDPPPNDPPPNDPPPNDPPPNDPPPNDPPQDDPENP